MSFIVLDGPDGSGTTTHSALLAEQLRADGQDVVLSTLQEKFNSESGVNIDEEMAHLLSLQNAYAANARVMSTVKQMFDALMQV